MTLQGFTIFYFAFHQGRVSSGGLQSRGPSLKAFCPSTLPSHVREADVVLGKPPPINLDIGQNPEVTAIGVPMPAPYVQRED